MSVEYFTRSVFEEAIYSFPNSAVESLELPTKTAE